MGERYDPLETLGAVLSALGLAGILITEGRALGLGLLVIAFGTVVWKMGEMRREFNEKLESLRTELESLKGQGNAADG
ncbi:hypothetical protein APY94_06840 [Thermococcus celericrescens]|uniref:Uncharacterized protein n=1 Tax=Thermococcus celericrescens TaxID=227598 RepID=A0A100XXN7_9EURY|nr:hypothetical protein [Thermococcus celericrescens]KUH33226.1 hypothetical protein APY94_06840 [Thermococcus celericrescens]